MSVRVAFASAGGQQIDEHFGSARFWQIYDIGDDAVYVEDRMTKPSCAGHCEGGFDDILETLKDCQAIFVAKIGEAAAAYTIAKGKHVFEALGSLEDITYELVTRKLLVPFEEKQEGQHGGQL